jgi:hypothetical protein
MPFTWPEHDTEYKVEVTDSIGCKGFDEVRVGIKPEVISKLSNKPNYLVVRDPTTGRSIIKFNFLFGTADFIVYNVKGEMIFKKQIASNTVDVGEAISSIGLYFFRLEKNRRILSEGKFLKQ